MSNLSKYKQLISNYLEINESQVFLFYKGRVALYALLKAYDIKENDEVILQGFTCVVVPNAIIYCRAKPIYVDIDLKNYNIDIKKLEAAITPKTKIIIAQNTFGLSPNFDAIMEIAQKHKLIVLEDCTHGFGGEYLGKKNGTIAHASFFSTQWNKPFSTGLGGFATVNDPSILSKMSISESSYIAPSFKSETVLKLLYFVREKLLKPRFYWFFVKNYRRLSKAGLIVGSSSGEEITGINMPKNYAMKLGNSQAKKGIQTITSIDDINRLRLKNAKLYNDYFKRKQQQKHVYEQYNNNIFLKFPLLVDNRSEFLLLAEKMNVQLGEWFNSPLHPIESNLDKWHYIVGSCPDAEFASKHMINLPTENEDMSQVFRLLETI